MSYDIFKPSYFITFFDLRHIKNLIFWIYSIKKYFCKSIRYYFNILSDYSSLTSDRLHPLGFVTAMDDANRACRPHTAVVIELFKR